jgi:hypothetical protein
VSNLILGSALLAMLAFAGKGDIFHCAGPDGAMVFQDKPCSSKGILLASETESADGDLLRLRQALKKIERSAPPPAPRAHVSSLMAQRWSHRGPADQGLLAACSSQFFACAGDNAPRMDRCVSAIPRCGSSRSGGCCPGECVARYQDLRRARFTPAQSVRDALLDDSVGSCAAR